MSLSSTKPPSRRANSSLFELQPKNKTVTVRMSQSLLDAIKKHAETRGINYQKLIRLAVERQVQGD